MKIEELKQQIETKTAEVRGFLEKSDNENAKKAMEELKGLKDTVKIAEELEADEKRDLENQKENKEERKGDNMEKINEMRAVVKYVTGKGNLNNEERSTIKTTDNSAVIPKEFINKLIELQKGYGSLKQLCDIIPVTRMEGSIPIVDLDQNEMFDIAEGADIVDGSFVTNDEKFKCTKVGLKQTITSETIDDAVVDIENLIKNNFANIATVKENKKIIKVITDNATEIENATNYEAVENAIDSSLPSVKLGLITLTNVTGYVHLKNMKDKQGRSLNLITNVGGVDYFNGKPIYYIEDALLQAGEDKEQVFYVLNMKEAVKYIDRKQVTIKRWEDNDNDTMKLSILERLDVIKGSARSIKKIEF